MNGCSFCWCWSSFTRFCLPSHVWWGLCWTTFQTGFMYSWSKLCFILKSTYSVLTNKTGEVKHCISLEGFWPLQCLTVNPPDFPDSTELCNSHLPAPDLTFHIFHFQLAKSFYETHNTCHMLCPGNGLVFPVGPANDVGCVPVVMSQCKWLRSSFYLSKCPMEAWAGFGPLGHC